MVSLQNSGSQTSNGTSTLPHSWACFLICSPRQQRHTFSLNLDIIKAPLFPPTNLQSSPGLKPNPFCHSKVTKACPSISLDTPTACPPGSASHPLSPSQRLHCFVSPFPLLIISLSHLTQSFQLTFKCALILLLYKQNEIHTPYQLHLTSELLSLVVQFFLKTLQTENLQHQVL